MLLRVISAVAVTMAIFAQTSITSCGGMIKWNTLTVTPSNPQAGDTASINGTGLVYNTVSGGTGQINAYLYGADMFQTNINTCGVGQSINILDIVSATFDGLNCPTTRGQQVNLGFVIDIPTMAAGLGQLNITLSANDTSPNGGKVVYCVDLVTTL